MHTNFDYVELLESARSVLRGLAPHGSFARIDDEKGRCRLAAVFMLRDARNALDPSSWKD